MKIVSMAVENIMKITSAFIVPTDSTILVQGGNAQGKSSCLDSIVMALAPKSVKTFPKQPLKAGSKKGSITIKVDGNDQIPPFTIVRSITEKGESLKIEPEKILAGETPRSFLDKLIGSISFDPLDFINKEPKKQRSTLMELIGLDVDEWERKEKEVFDERTIKGRELKIAEAKVNGAVVYEDVGTEELKVGDLTEKLQKAIKDNQEISNRKNANEKLKESAIEIKDVKIPELKKEIVELQSKLLAKQADLEAMESDLNNKREQYKKEKDDLSLTFPTDTSEIEVAISNIESTNSKIRHNKQIQSELAEKDSIQAAYDEIDQRLETIRADKLKAIQEANIPVPGLAFDDDGLVYNSIPLSQCSDGEKLMIGMGISMALNPTMRVLRIKDGSLLDNENLKIIQDMVKEKDYQVFVERVSSLDQYNATGKVGIYIEEGEIIMMDGKAVEKKLSTKKSDTPIKNNQAERVSAFLNTHKDEDW